MKTIFLALAFALFPAFAGAKTPAPPPKPQAITSNPACAPANSAHCTILTWGASPSAAACAAPSCSFAYLIFRGTMPGGEGSTPIGTTTTLTYVDPITLGATVQNFYYTVEAQETETGTNGTVVAASAPSNEAPATFPGLPASPTAATAATN